MNNLSLYALLKFKNEDTSLYDSKVVMDFIFAYDIKQCYNIVWDNIKSLYQAALNIENDEEIKYLSTSILCLLRSYVYEIGFIDLKDLHFENDLSSSSIYTLFNLLNIYLIESQKIDESQLLCEIDDYVKNILDIKEDNINDN